MKTLQENTTALRNIFRVTPDNSDREKFIFWGVLGLWVVGGLGLVTGAYDPDQTLWRILSSAILLQGGRLWGKESERLK